MYLYVRTKYLLGMSLLRNSINRKVSVDIVFQLEITNYFMQIWYFDLMSFLRQINVKKALIQQRINEVLEIIIKYVGWSSSTKVGT